jgi:hypothetical protein
MQVTSLSMFVLSASPQAAEVYMIQSFCLTAACCLYREASLSSHNESKSVQLVALGINRQLDPTQELPAAWLETSVCLCGPPVVQHPEPG